MADRRNRRDFTRAEAAALIEYDPATGVFRWKIKRNSYGGGIRPGDEAGTVKDGYVQIVMFGLPYRAQHLAWLSMTGEWPSSKADVEHRDRNRANNAWGNLRLATRSQNNMNMAPSSANKSGCRGVSLRKDTGKWHARIVVGRKTILLGDFTSKADAIAARRAAEPQYFGDFAAA